MATILTLTDEQAEMLGFALTKAMREQRDAAHRHENAGKPQAARGCFERAAAIEEIRSLLDSAPQA